MDDLIIILPKHLTSLEWMKAMKDIKSNGFAGDETEKK